MEAINLLHSILRWVILVLLAVTIFKAWSGNKNKTPYTDSDKKLALFSLIAVHLQLVIGFIQYLWGPLGIKNISNLGMGEVMKNSYSRFFAVEHISMMLLAIILITVAYSGAKRMADDQKKHKRIFIFYLIALVLILAAIPWPFRAGFEALGWF